MENLIYLFVALFGISVSGQITKNELCPNVTLMQNFDIQKYNSTWHEIEMYGEKDTNKGRTDVEYNFEYNNNTKTLSVIFTGKNNGTSFNETGFANINETQQNKILIKYGATKSVKHWILSTDYTSYSLVYSCENTNKTDKPESLVNSWILGKSKDLIKTDTMKKVLEAANLDTTKFYKNSAFTGKAMALLVFFCILFNKMIKHQ